MADIRNLKFTATPAFTAQFPGISAEQINSQAFAKVHTDIDMHQLVAILYRNNLLTLNDIAKLLKDQYTVSL